MLGQNLVPDSSFENNVDIPTDFSAIGLSRTWSKASLGTSDLFCKCGKKQKKYSLVNVPNNAMGNQVARSGTCYAGLFALSHGSYREYLQTPLRTPLEKDKLYQLKMYISLADYSRAAIDQLGIFFSTTRVNFKSTNVITKVKPVYLQIKSAVRKDTDNWQCLTGVYRSTGEESYLIIGSFKINEVQKTHVYAPKEAKTRINQITDRDAYYYIDDVSLIEIADTTSYIEVDSIVEEKNTIAVAWTPGVPFVPENILFKTNESGLSPESYTSLNKLVDYLTTNQKVIIEITGHTDTIGNDKLNQKLSEERARSVAEFLIANKIDSSRINYKGFGSSKPVATNSTRAGQRLNRRVEFTIR
jgi:OOP family OmpA-OmpF porin